jgi:hypothetical protein
VRAEREGDGLVVVLPGVVVEAVHADGVLPQPHRDHLVAELLVRRKGDAVVADGAVQGEREAPDARRREGKLVHLHARAAGFLRDQHGLMRAEDGLRPILVGDGDERVPDVAEVHRRGLGAVPAEDPVEDRCPAAGPVLS